MAINITDKSLPPIPADMLAGWEESHYNVSVEDLITDLYKVYTYNELMQLEVEYVTQNLVDVPSLFVDKLHCITALINTPEGFMKDVAGFINVVSVCNDEHAPLDKIVYHKPGYIMRAIDAVNKIWPDDLDINENNILRPDVENYVVECYLKEYRFIMEKPLDYLQPVIFRHFPSESRDEMKKNMDTVNSIYLGHIKPYIDSHEAKIIEILTDDVPNGKQWPVMLEHILSRVDKISNQWMYELNGLMVDYIYRRFYKHV
jgi:hypothetical protein